MDERDSRKADKLGGVGILARRKQRILAEVALGGNFCLGPTFSESTQSSGLKLIIVTG